MLYVRISKFPDPMWQRSLRLDPRILSIPLPTYRLASFALRALEVDAELSPLVRRSFSLASPDSSRSNATTPPTHLSEATDARNDMLMNGVGKTKTVLVTEYRATTNRMLRVAVNGFMESLGVVLGVMEELDVDVLSAGRDTL